MSKLHPVTRSFLWFSLALFAASLSQDTYELEGDVGRTPWVGLAMLLIGWLGVFMRIAAWLANPAVVLAWALLLSGRKRSATVSAVTALGLALSFLLQEEIVRDEGGQKHAVVGYHLGDWLWVASIASTLCACLAAVVLTPHDPLRRRTDSSD